MKIVIVDPGLKEVGGHHPGYISALSGLTEVSNGSIPITVYSHRNLCNTYDAGCVTIIRHFSTRFYKYFRVKPTLEQKTKYIAHLASEYLSVFEKNQNASGEKTLFLYHTLCKEHAQALNTAIKLNKKTSANHKHCVFLMFSPPSTNDVASFLDYRISFKGLMNNSNVQLFTSDKEASTANKIALDNTINIHPCLLTDSPQTRVEQKNKSETRILLFVGDAKVEKGFLDLPDIMRQLSDDVIASNLKYIIQFTCGKYDKRLNEVKEQVITLAKSDSRFEVHECFWSDDEINTEFAQSNAILLNYDELVYQNKSSGVLWLAASKNIHCIFLSNTWLNREAKRLACEYTLTNKKGLTNIVRQLTAPKTHNTSIHSPPTSTQLNYRKQLFMSFFDWIEGIWI